MMVFEEKIPERSNGNRCIYINRDTQGIECKLLRYIPVTKTQNKQDVKLMTKVVLMFYITTSTNACSSFYEVSVSDEVTYVHT